MKKYTVTLEKTDGDKKDIRTYNILTRDDMTLDKVIEKERRMMETDNIRIIKVTRSEETKTV